MFKFSSVSVVAALSVLTGCGCERVSPGNKGIIVDTWGKSEKGSIEVVGPGRYYTGMGDEVYIFPISLQNKVWTSDMNEDSSYDQSISIQTLDGLDVKLNVGISYRIDPEKVLFIFKRYRKGISEITDVFMRNYVRDAFVKESSLIEVVDLYGKGKTALLKRVEKRIKEELKEDGIIVEKIYLVGEMVFPQVVKDAIRSKIQAGQKAQQREVELKETLANAEKKKAEAEGEAKSLLIRAKAQAEANRIVSKSITPEVLKSKFLEKWNGELPSTITNGADVDMTKLIK